VTLKFLNLNKDLRSVLKDVDLFTKLMVVHSNDIRNQLTINQTIMVYSYIGSKYFIYVCTFVYNIITEIFIKIALL